MARAFLHASGQTSFAEFVFVHCPHCAFDVLHAHETFVQREVVSHGILERRCIRLAFGRGKKANLPRLRILAKVEKLCFKPFVHLVQRQLTVGRFNDCLNDHA